MSVLFDSVIAVDELRGTRLGMVPKAYVKDIGSLSDAYLLSKLMAAEAEAARRLGFPITPTEFFPNEPTDAEIAALNGAPYLVESGYDFAPDFSSLS